MTVCEVQGEPQVLPKAEAGSRGDQSCLERLLPPVHVGMAFTQAWEQLQCLGFALCVSSVQLLWAISLSGSCNPPPYVSDGAGQLPSIRL